MVQTELLEAAAALARHLKQQHPDASKDDLAAILTLTLITVCDSADASTLLRDRGIQGQKLIGLVGRFQKQDDQPWL